MLRNQCNKATEYTGGLTKTAATNVSKMVEGRILCDEDAHCMCVSVETGLMMYCM